METRYLLFMIIATYAKAAGLSREEASNLWSSLQARDVPESVDQAYEQLDHALQTIRRLRTHEDY